jgi:hypothetical protein
MTSRRKQRAKVQRKHQVMCRRRLAAAREDKLWGRMSPVGREFGSPDFERLMAEDHRLGRGVFDPAVRHAFVATPERLADNIEVPDDLPLQPRVPI